MTTVREIVSGLFPRLRRAEATPAHVPDVKRKNAPRLMPQKPKPAHRPKGPKASDYASNM